MKSLIAGFGEVGKGLHEALKDYNPTCIDPSVNTGEIFKYSSGLILTGIEEEPIEIMHVCFPYSEQFIEQVKAYQDKYKPKYTVIHSTVPVGTSRVLGATFSPIVGIHPHLGESIKTFTKFLAGEQASDVANYFRRAGLKVYLFPDQETAELAKLSQTTFYALMIEYVKHLDLIAREQGLSFSEVYTIFSQDYNRGYEELGRSEFKMPLLVPITKKQGGHCTIRNCDLWDNIFTQFIKQCNDLYE